MMSRVTGLTQFEEAVLEKLLAGDEHTLVLLRAQAKRSRLRSRENTGVGFHTYFEVPTDLPRLGRVTFNISDVNAVIPGLAHGAGFVLFVTAGALEQLEGFTYDEPWPSRIDSFHLTYQTIPRQLALPDVSSPDG